MKEHKHAKKLRKYEFSGPWEKPRDKDDAIALAMNLERRAQSDQYKTYQFQRERAALISELTRDMALVSQRAPPKQQEENRLFVEYLRDLINSLDEKEKRKKQIHSRAIDDICRSPEDNRLKIDFTNEIRTYDPTQAEYWAFKAEVMSRVLDNSTMYHVEGNLGAQIILEIYELFATYETQEHGIEQTFLDKIEEPARATDRTKGKNGKNYLTIAQNNEATTWHRQVNKRYRPNA